MAMGSLLDTRDSGEYIIDKIYFQSAGNRIIGWVMRPPGEGPYPIVIYNHGSRVSQSGKPNLEQPTLGLSTKAWPGVIAGRCLLFFPEGSGYAGSEGPKLTECRSNPDVMQYLRHRADDVSAGVNWLQDQSWADTEKIGLTGCSHGAVVSLLAAQSGRYGSVVAQAPGASIDHPALGLDQMANAIRRTDAPILLQHAEDDTLCPVETSKSLYEHGKKAKSDIVLSVYPSISGIEGHAQFNFENRAIWASEFDAALQPIVGERPEVIMPKRG